MTLQNGYKVVYEVAKDGKRTFYAAKSNVYPNADDLVIASFDDADYRDRVIYEYKGSFYVSEAGHTPAYDENGVPTDERLAAFDQVFLAAGSAAAVAAVEETEPAVVVEDDEPETPVEPEDEEPEELEYEDE